MNLYFYKKYFIIFLICLSSFALYVDLSPDIGNIICRSGYISIFGFLDLIVHPLFNSYMWNLNLLSTNFIFWFLLCLLIDLIL